MKINKLKPNLSITYKKTRNSFADPCWQYKCVAMTPWGDVDVVGLHGRDTKKERKEFNQSCEIAVYRFLIEAMAKRGFETHPKWLKIRKVSHD